MQPSPSPPGMTPDDQVILFDGVCKLCNAWCRFIIRHDHERLFRFASVQAPAGQRILEHFDMPTTTFDTLLYVEGNRLFDRSDAFLRIVGQLGQPWKSLALLRFFPRGLRDWCYDRIARNRYAIFGRYDECLLPDPDHDRRFLDDGG